MCVLWLVVQSLRAVRVQVSWFCWFSYPLCGCIPSFYSSITVSKLHPLLGCGCLHLSESALSGSFNAESWIAKCHFPPLLWKTCISVKHWVVPGQSSFFSIIFLFTWHLNHSPSLLSSQSSSYKFLPPLPLPISAEKEKPLLGTTLLWNI